MKKKTKTYLVIVLVALFITGAYIQTSNARGQSDIILTWKALNFYPSDYQGKAAASPGSSVLISAMMIENGRLVDLSENMITWYLNGTTVLKRGVGVKDVLLKVNRLQRGRYIVRVKIDNRGSNTFYIPVKDKEVVIETPTVDRMVFPNSIVDLTAVPYFFNIKSFGELTFNWRVNNISKETEENSITLNLAKEVNKFDRNVFVSVLSYNPEDKYESADSEIFLRLVKEK